MTYEEMLEQLSSARAVVERWRSEGEGRHAWVRLDLSVQAQSPGVEGADVADVLELDLALRETLGEVPTCTVAIFHQGELVDAGDVPVARWEEILHDASAAAAAHAAALERRAARLERDLQDMRATLQELRRAAGMEDA